MSAKRRLTKRNRDNHNSQETYVDRHSCVQKHGPLEPDLPRIPKSRGRRQSPHPEPILLSRPRRGPHPALFRESACSTAILARPIGLSLARHARLAATELIALWHCCRRRPAKFARAWSTLLPRFRISMHHTVIWVRAGFKAETVGCRWDEGFAVPSHAPRLASPYSTRGFGCRGRAFGIGRPGRIVRSVHCSRGPIPRGVWC
jgi:hypothetical protein